MQGIPYFIKEEAVIKEELVFSFVSKGSKGDVEKIIHYSRTTSKLFNLGFGDRIGNTMKYDDLIVTNNGDMVKVFTTVIHTFSIFFSLYPNDGIFIRGSDEKRIRVYNALIKRNLNSFLKDYHVFGMKDDKSAKLLVKKNLLEEDGHYKYFAIFKLNVL